MNFPYKTVVYYDEEGKPVYHKVGYCNSGETKPTGNDAKDIADGSILTESDTGDVYFYNGNAGSWGKMFSFKEG